MASQYDIQLDSTPSASGMMKEDTTKHPDYAPDPLQKGQEDVDSSKALNLTERDVASDSAAAQVQPDSSAASSCQQSGITLPVLTQSSTKPDIVAEQQEEEFAHPNDFLHSVDSPEDPHSEGHLGDKFCGGNLHDDVLTAARDGVVGWSSPECSNPPPVPSKHASIVEQQETLSSLHTTETMQFEDHGSRHDLYVAPESTQNEPEHSNPPLPPSKNDPVSEQRNKHPLGIYADGHSSDKDADPAPQHDLPVTPSNEQSILVGQEPTHPLEQREVVADSHTMNVVFFGETGVGKSSVINLIAGQKLARTSNDAHGCTFHHERYHIRLGNTSCALWDTTGLDEGSEGTVPAKLAENNLRELMRGLVRSGGIHLVIYCIRGTRLTKALKRNYDLFYVTVCRKKVPVALVITGLEHQEGGMETWWAQNSAALRRNRMQFDTHACVTTVDVEDAVIQQRRSESRELLHKLIAEFSGLPGWKTDPSLLSRIFPLFHSVLRGVGGLGINVTTRKVAVCGTFPALLPGTTAIWDRSTGRIGNRQYQFLRADKHVLHTVAPLPSAYFRGTGMLLFYASTLVENCITPTDIDMLKTFYDVAGGQSCPVVVVLQDCDDEQVALGCRDAITSRHSDIQVHLVSIPSETRNDAGSKLDEMIESLCIEQVEVRGQNFWKKIFGASS